MAPQARRSRSTIEAVRQDKVSLPDGRTLTQDQLFSVHGERGWFSFRYVRNNDVTAWGPVNTAGSQNAQWRSFTPSNIKRIKRIIKEKS